MLRQKLTPILRRKKETIHLCLFHESHFSNICTLQYVTTECIEINWLCKHREKVRSSRTSISINPCNELSKAQFCMWVLLTHFMPLVSLISPENIRKPKVFWCFQGVSKETSGMKLANVRGVARIRTNIRDRKLWNNLKGWKLLILLNHCYKIFHLRCMRVL